MIAKRRNWLAAAAFAVLCGGLAGWLIWQRGRALNSVEALVARVPSRDAVVLYVDFTALRAAGLLAMLSGTQPASEPEYRDFIAKTHFDYARDLDAAVLAFAPGGRYILARGRFDWERLRAYAEQSGGACRDGLCRMPGSAPDRNISWTALQSGVLALAVSRDPQAVDLLRSPAADARTLEISHEPLWLALPPAALRTGTNLPPGTRMFARALENADGLVFTLGPDRRQFALKMDVRCRSAEDARALAQAMDRTTATVRDWIAREKQAPNPRDLSGVIAAGSFRSEGARVRGYWPVERAFFEELFRGAGPA